jgi:AraC family transcriptional regulator, ethanolamine operon transcriptional activator
VTAIMRARLTLPTLTLSLLKTFPRIIRGYQFTNAAAVAVPMDHVTSARINGQSIGGSVLVLKGDSDCLVHEPEGRLLAVVYFSPSGREPLPELGDGCHLLNPAPDVLASLRRLISISLETAANDPDFLNEPASQKFVEQSLLSTMDAAIWSSVASGPVSSTAEHYRRIVADMEKLIRRDLMIWHKTTELAEQAGVSVRTLQSATRAICGMSPHRYSRVLRLWSECEVLCACAWFLASQRVRSELQRGFRRVAFGDPKPIATRRIATCLSRVRQPSRPAPPAPAPARPLRPCRPA